MREIGGEVPPATTSTQDTRLHDAFLGMGGMSPFGTSNPSTDPQHTHSLQQYHRETHS